MNNNSPPFEVGSPRVGYRSNDFRIIYSNAYRFRVSPSDMAITFCLASDNPMDPTKSAIRDEMAVYMTLSQAKTLQKELTDLISALEKQFGEIKIAHGTTTTEKGTIDQMVEQMAASATPSSNLE